MTQSPNVIVANRGKLASVNGLKIRPPDMEARTKPIEPPIRIRLYTPPSAPIIERQYVSSSGRAAFQHKLKISVASTIDQSSFESNSNTDDTSATSKLPARHQYTSPPALSIGCSKKGAIIRVPRNREKTIPITAAPKPDKLRCTARYGIQTPSNAKKNRYARENRISNTALYLWGTDSDVGVLSAVTQIMIE